MSAPVQTATMNYCIKLARQVSDSRDQSNGSVFASSLSRDLCRSFPHGESQSREVEERGVDFLIFLFNETSDMLRLCHIQISTFITLSTISSLSYRFSNGALRLLCF